ncbi:hypothetical protein Tco_0212995 [Tanacetum coccineum]
MFLSGIRYNTLNRSTSFRAGPFLACSEAMAGMFSTFLVGTLLRMLLLHDSPRAESQKDFGRVRLTQSWERTMAQHRGFALSLWRKGENDKNRYWLSILFLEVSCLQERSAHIHKICLGGPMPSGLGEGDQRLGWVGLLRSEVGRARWGFFKRLYVQGLRAWTGFTVISLNPKYAYKEAEKQRPFVHSGMCRSHPGGTIAASWWE